MEKEKNKLLKECEYCKTNASCLCFECNSYFCDRCYKAIHVLRDGPNHKKENIDVFVPIDLKCPEHPKDRMNLFCIDEKGNSKL